MAITKQDLKDAMELALILAAFAAVLPLTIIALGGHF